MAWIYFQEAEDSPKDCTAGSGRSLTVRSSPALNACSCPAWPEANYMLPPFGMMCGRCAGVCSPRWTSSPGVFLARTSVLSAIERGWAEGRAGLCLNSSASLANADHKSSSWKTSQISLFGGLTAYSWDSMRWGMMHGGQLFQPQRLAPRSCESEHGLWPTLTVHGNHNAPKEGTARGTGLSTAVKRWAAPTAKNAPRSEKFRTGRTPMLAEELDGPLNPTWTEWLMGWPIGSTVCESWVMESSHFALRKRSRALAV